MARSSAVSSPQTYPTEVAGLLLLDPWPEDFDEQLQAMVTDQQWTAYESLLAK